MSCMSASKLYVAKEMPPEQFGGRQGAVRETFGGMTFHRFDMSLTWQIARSSAAGDKSVENWG